MLKVRPTGATGKPKPVDAPKFQAGRQREGVSKAGQHSGSPGGPGELLGRRARAARGVGDPG